MIVYGSILLESQPALPAASGPIGFVSYNDTLWTNYGGAWNPFGSFGAGTISDTLTNIYLLQSMKFVDGGYIITNGATGIRIHPSGDPSQYITIIQNENTGTSITGVDNLQFSALTGINSDPMQGFRDDATEATDEDKVTLSARAIREIAGSGGISPDQPVHFADSTYLDYEGTSTNNDRIVKLTGTGAMEAVNLPNGFMYSISQDTAFLATDNENIPVASIFSGTNLIHVEAYAPNSAGTRVPTINVYRNRGGTEVLMTSSAANFTTDATINTTYDDVIRGDKLKLSWTLSGTSADTKPDGIIVVFIFQKP
jgi:hypothetical protein